MIFNQKKLKYITQDILNTGKIVANYYEKNKQHIEFYKDLHYFHEFEEDDYIKMLLYIFFEDNEEKEINGQKYIEYLCENIDCDEKQLDIVKQKIIKNDINIIEAIKILFSQNELEEYGI